MLRGRRRMLRGPAEPKQQRQVNLEAGLVGAQRALGRLSTCGSTSAVFRCHHRPLPLLSQLDCTQIQWHVHLSPQIPAIF